MKHWILLLAALLGFSALARGQSPGLYQGYISVKRSNPALRISDVTTLLVRGEYYIETNTSLPALVWTPTNADPLSKLTNSWCRVYLATVVGFPVSTMPEMALSGTNIRIPGGSIVPGSFKMAANSINWKTTTIGSPSRRPTTITTTVSLTRIGPLPEPP